MDPAEQELRKQKKKEAALAAKAAKVAKAAEKAGQKEKWKNQTQAGPQIRLKGEFVNETPVGSKKDLSGEFTGDYNPPAVEAAWYEWWVKEGFFSPEYVRPGQSAEEHAQSPMFVMVIPPPNVTGALHIGHALTNSVEDFLARWHRMHGARVLWLPGTDHAGIATQSVVERRLLADEGKTKHDLGREAFVKRVWQWKEKYGGQICHQLRRLGSSVDWTREAFTMDDNLTLAVKEAFVRMYEKGLISRAERLVNWSCALLTCISDIECDDWEITEPQTIPVKGHPEGKKYEFGYIWSFAYKVDGSDEELVVATTRPETMLGDTAVAVHPNDERYKHLHGKFLVHPFVQRKIPVICDPILVEMGLGTGAVKVTPGHDPKDYECGKRNNLPIINIMNNDGTLNSEAGEFAGMKRFEARVAVLEKLEKLGSYKGKAKNAMTIKVCSRSGDIIEPILKPQWWVDCTDLAAKSVAAVKNGDLKIVPEWKISQWNHMLENVRPWCISRQLWWGHRIPAYLAWKKGDSKPDGSNPKSWVIARTQEEAQQKAVQLLGTSDVELQQDEDVLDTWFSSGLFPFSVMGWPKETDDLKKYYPGTLLETGHDIIFFWVARMVMMAYELTGQLPFKEVLLHGLVRDAEGEKISKSKGNVIDPIDVIEGITLEKMQQNLEAGNLKKTELDQAKKNQKKFFPRGISECGTDALRFGLLAYSNDGKDLNLDIKRVEGYRAFCNKLWNAMKLSLMLLGKDYKPLPANTLTGHEGPMDKWILSRLNAALVAIDAAFEARDFAKLTVHIHGLWLHDFCDVYLEVAKPVAGFSAKGVPEERKNGLRNALYWVLDAGLKALHPIMPFITEELWQRLPRRPNDLSPSICVAAYPLASSIPSNSEIEKEFSQVFDAFVRPLRICLTTQNILKKGVTEAKFLSTHKEKDLLEKYNVEICALAYLKDLQPTDQALTTGYTPMTPEGDATVFVSLQHVAAKKPAPPAKK